MRGSFKDKYYFYDGTETLEELEEHLDYLGLPRSKCYFIKFLDQYYAVFYDTFVREVIVGKEKMFLSKNGRLEECVIGDVRIPFTIKTRDKGRITPTLAVELNKIDPGLRVMYYPNVNSKNVKEAEEELKLSKYVVLLGLSFASKYYDVNNLHEMQPYFKLTRELITFLQRTRGAVAINPFTQCVRFEDGGEGKYGITFYPGVYNHNQAAFALVERNRYGHQGRAWISLIQYQELYPNDFINYPKPDFRVDKDTCKWCSEKLDQTKKHYCSDACKYQFLKATEIGKGSGLPSKILYRDQFVCQKCGIDMAFINEHGVKIPVSRLSDVPDRNGNYKREAEVHHLIPVEDGGEDFQENLSTRCQTCHKGEHKVRKKKTNVIAFRPR